MALLREEMDIVLEQRLTIQTAILLSGQRTR